MTKDVLVRIRGLQAMEHDGEHDADEIEIITSGIYYLKNGKHYIMYEEVLEGFEGVVKNSLRITPDSLVIRKTGALSANMVFDLNHPSRTCYETPMGDMMIDISTKGILVDEQEDSMEVRVTYALDINEQRAAECNIHMDICSKEKADLRLES